ncbi:hypothetical protein DAPPUDRAFT_267830 [Daphnia pulex]|uniref:Uncharacterized protein n=1 Tax=Daphnia pulex TaxID=6669 RepID=E9HWZ7_DAPPU|nr:hypothetical protein DAPPUDRAFT_267830 [Daphnia pulex]|eukprot:EFX63724.1 hypothetical protein DAPPUDRAFT_267830 [Daphnia pulex]
MKKKFVKLNRRMKPLNYIYGSELNIQLISQESAVTDAQLQPNLETTTKFVDEPVKGAHQQRLESSDPVSKLAKIGDKTKKALTKHSKVWLQILDCIKCYLACAPLSLKAFELTFTNEFLLSRLAWTANNFVFGKKWIIIGL